MLTWILMLVNEVPTANTVLILVVAAWLLYLLLFAVLKANRGKRQFKIALISGAVATAVCDIVWFFKFFDNFTYLNPGLEAYLWLCAIFAAMLLLVMVQSYFNVNRFQHEENLRKKEGEKERKRQSRKKRFEAQSETPAEEKKE